MPCISLPPDMKKAPEGAFFICYAICGVRRRQADFLQLIAASCQQKGTKGPVSRRLGEKSVEGHPPFGGLVVYRKTACLIV